MLGLCLYVPVSNSDPIEVEYFESNGLPSELKSVFNKLSVFLPSQEFSAYQKWRKKTLKRKETNSDGQLDFEEFVHYLQDYEKDLKLVVKSIDRKNAGPVDPKEFMQSLQDLGVHISPQHAEKALKSMDKNGMITIGSQDWSNYPMVEKTENIPEIILYWKHSTIFDVGENLMVPDEFTVEEKLTGMWWRHLVAGGGAGACFKDLHRPPGQT
ncbi:Calcium-binding mitochondrial carrier protein SCaMC-2-A [Larimichthys crocea]|uniref:Uncharacterized protein n=1 Tax=Larimichthys crocea TaxID=215358 RepID=A0ACD3QA08_LARCR|nr:Calcium-binding mitochondrial carrier protein SCaMC-2-A [Larimichthys crocea]